MSVWQIHSPDVMQMSSRCQKPDVKFDICTTLSISDFFDRCSRYCDLLVNTLWSVGIYLIELSILITTSFKSLLIWFSYLSIFNNIYQYHLSSLISHLSSLISHHSSLTTHLSSLLHGFNDILKIIARIQIVECWFNWWHANLVIISSPPKTR